MPQVANPSYAIFACSLSVGADCLRCPLAAELGRHQPVEPASSDGALQLEAHEGVDLLRKLVRQFVENIRAEAGDDGSHGLLGVDAALLEVEQLVFANLARARLVLHARALVAHLRASPTPSAMQFQGKYPLRPSPYKPTTLLPDAPS